MRFVDLLLDPFGTVPGSSLNWSQHGALLEAGSRHCPTRARRHAAVAAEMRNLGRSTQQVVDAVRDLERSVGLRLDAQTEELRRQADKLTKSAEMQRNPRYIRSAERLRQASVLLGQHRYERALAAAHEAIEDHPADPNGSVAAGWACWGLRRPEDARSHFLEAARASARRSPEMDAIHVRAVLLASRLAFVLEGPLKAEVGLFRLKPYRSDLALRRLVGERPDEWFDLRWALAAVAYDTAVYEAQQAHPSPEALSESLRAKLPPSRQAEWSAIEYLKRACDLDVRFCWMALTDPLLERPPELRAAAVQVLRDHDRVVRDFRRGIDAGWREFAKYVTQLQEYGALADAELAPYLQPDHPNFGNTGGRMLYPRSDYRGVRDAALREIEQLGARWFQAENTVRACSTSLEQWWSRDTFDRFTTAAKGVLCREERLARQVAEATRLKRRDLRIIDKGPDWVLYGFTRTSWLGPRTTIGVITLGQEPTLPSGEQLFAGYNRAMADRNFFYLADGRRLSRRKYERYRPQS